MKHEIYKVIVFCITVAILGGCMKDDELNLEYSSYTPKELNDGILISTPEEEGVDAIALNTVFEAVYTDENLWSLRSLLVFRNNRLIAESYLKDDLDITTQRLVWSCTKQVVGVLIGIAIENEIIQDLNDPISMYFNTELKGHSDKKDIRIKNLLTMRSGIDYNNDGVGGETDKLLRQIPDNSVDFVLVDHYLQNKEVSSITMMVTQTYLWH